MYVQCSSTERRNGLCSSTLRSVGLVSFSILFWWSGRRFANRRLLHYVPTASNRDGLVRRGSIKRPSSSRAALTSSCEHSLRRCPARGPTASNRDGLVRRGSVKRRGPLPSAAWKWTLATPLGSHHCINLPGPPAQSGSGHTFRLDRQACSESFPSFFSRHAFKQACKTS